MLVAIINDTHTGVRNASDVFLDYTARFYAEVFFPYCDAHGIKQVIHLGDYYDHRKYVSFKALNHNRRTFLEPLRDRGITMDLIPGNHDVFYKNTNDLCSLKELLGFFTRNVNIIMRPRVMNYAGLDIGFLPWINAENYAESMRFLETCAAPILCSHLELAGFEMMKGMPPAQHGMDATPLSRFEKVLTGHYHTKSSRGNIHYLGTQYEMTWSDCDDPKFFHVLDTETREIIAVPNPINIFAKVVYDDKKWDYDGFDVTTLRQKFVKVIVTQKTDLAKFDSFIDRIQKENVHELKIAENYDEFLGENVQDTEEMNEVSDTSGLLDAYVDAAQTDLDKNSIKARLRELYVEAQSSEIV
jgi:DNA repair exonuclease SbcCD nuclease subunit